MLNGTNRNPTAIDWSTAKVCHKFIYKHSEILYHQVFNSAGSKFMFAQIRELAKDRTYRSQTGVDQSSSTGQSQVTGGYADNRGSFFKRSIEYVVTKEKIDQAMRGIPYNQHVRGAKIRNEQRAQDQECQE